MVFTSRYDPICPVDERPLGVWLMEAIAGHGHGLAFVDGVTGQETTHAQVYSWVRSVETGLHSLGLRQGDVGAVVFNNCAEYGVIFLALACRGAVTSGVNPVYTKDELVRHFKDCKARYAFTDMDHVAIVRAAAAEVRHVECVFVVCTGAEAARLPTDPGIRAFFSLRVPAAPLPRVGRPHGVEGGGRSGVEVALDPRRTTVALPYSSGTTGVPKGVMLTHYAMAAGHVNRGIFRPDFKPPSDDAHILCFLPFFHIYGLAALLMEGLRRGFTLVLMPHFSPPLFYQLLQDHKVENLLLVPPIMVLLAKDPMADKYDLSNLKRVTVGAAPAGRELIKEFITKYPHVLSLTQGYGMTETTGATHLSPVAEDTRRRHGTCGVLCPSIQIVDIKTGQDINQYGKQGEIWIRSPTLMAGYLNRPQETAETIDKDGWLHTGDIGYVDSEGYWYVVDRIKELIKVKGFQVAPAELEDLLLGCEGVADAAVIGVPDPKAGELPKAFIVKHQGAHLSEADVQAFVRGRVAPYKELKGGIRFVDQIPKSPSGKILRRLLRDSDSKAKL